MKNLYEFLINKPLTNNQNDKYTAIDLDLPSGTKWANCNVGADKPEDYGLLFQFGRTDGYKYGYKNHKFLSFDDTFDYNTTSKTKYKNGDTLKPEDDAAHVNMGNKWRIPTNKEINELLDNTDNEWTKLNGVTGRKFISKKDDSKWIFIPCSGCFLGSDHTYFYSDANFYLWSSSVFVDGFNYISGYKFVSDSKKCACNKTGCTNGFGVRAVLA